MFLFIVLNFCFNYKNNYMFILNIVSAKALRKNSRYFESYHLKVIQGNILINAFSRFSLMPHSFFIEMLTLYILSSPTFRPTSIFFFNIFVMVTQDSILLTNYNVSIHHPLGGGRMGCFQCLVSNSAHYASSELNL